MFIGSSELTVTAADGSINTIMLDCAPQISEGKTLVPLRAVSESLDCPVFWSAETKTAKIYTDPSKIPVSNPAPTPSTPAKSAPAASAPANPAPTPSTSAKPAPTVSTPAPSASSSYQQTVYVGKTGTKYHHADCRTLRGKGIAITLGEALAEGRELCKVCY